MTYKIKYFIGKKAFKICPLVNLVEKIWINFKDLIWNPATSQCM